MFSQKTRYGPLWMLLYSHKETFFFYQFLYGQNFRGNLGKGKKTIAIDTLFFLSFQVCKSKSLDVYTQANNDLLHIYPNKLAWDTKGPPHYYITWLLWVVYLIEISVITNNENMFYIKITSHLKEKSN
jgi:hypothetical protein